MSKDKLTKEEEAEDEYLGMCTEIEEEAEVLFCCDNYALIKSKDNKIIAIQPTSEGIDKVLVE